MKKIITLIATVALASVVFGMAKAPADNKACGAEKACAIKESASCCTKDGSCKTEAAGCAKTAAKEAAECAKAEAEKAAECARGTCPLPK